MNTLDNAVSLDTAARTNGSGAAAIISAGVGCFALAVLAILGDKAALFKISLNFYKPTGPLSGVTTVAILVPAPLFSRKGNPVMSMIQSSYTRLSVSDPIPTGRHAVTVLQVGRSVQAGRPAVALVMQLKTGERMSLTLDTQGGHLLGLAAIDYARLSEQKYRGEIG